MFTALFTAYVYPENGCARGAKTYDGGARASSACSACWCVFVAGSGCDPILSCFFFSPSVCNKRKKEGRTVNCVLDILSLCTGVYVKVYVSVQNLPISVCAVNAGCTRKSLILWDGGRNRPGPVAFFKHEEGGAGPALASRFREVWDSR